MTLAEENGKGRWRVIGRRKSLIASEKIKEARRSGMSKGYLQEGGGHLKAHQ
jgi:hypothetical protein